MRTNASDAVSPALAGDALALVEAKVQLLLALLPESSAARLATFAEAARALRVSGVRALLAVSRGTARGRLEAEGHCELAELARQGLDAEADALRAAWDAEPASEDQAAEMRFAVAAYREALAPIVAAGELLD